MYPEIGDTYKMSHLSAIVKSPSVSQADYYEAHADEYFTATVGLDMSGVYERFLNELVPGTHIADAGCGSGRDTKTFLQRGYVVTAFDGSPEMARVASAYSGQKCGVLQFQDMQFQQEFDAIWACASLLHVPKHEMRNVLHRFFTALKPGGIIYASFIEGEGERIGADGRLYNSYTEESFRDLLGRIGTIREISCWKSDETSRPVERAPWLNFLVKTSTR
jgi:2-polyprenyl-3-methyl-5-hydroxy-6-metoxy-1,4-benzoquinol methylase